MASAQALKKQEQLEAGKRRVCFLFSMFWYIFILCLLLGVEISSLCQLLYVYIFYMNLCMSFSVCVSLFVE